LPALLLLLLPQGADAVALKWQFKAGDTFVQTTTSKLNQTVKIGEQEFKQDLIHTTQIRNTIKEVAADGTVTLEQKVESIKATNPDGTAAAGSNAVLNQLQNVTFTSKLDKELKVQQLEGYDELVKRIAGDDPSVRRVVQALLSENQLKSVLHNSFAFVPPEPVKPGAVWNREVTLSLGPLGSVLLKQDFNFTGVETKDGKSLAKVTFKPTVVYTAPKPEASNPEMSITSGSIQPGDSLGTLWFDTAAGRLDRSETKLHLKGNLTVKLGGKESPVTFEQTQTIEVRITK
jgi:hypothetical protein